MCKSIIVFYNDAFTILLVNLNYEKNNQYYFVNYHLLLM